MNTNDAPAPAPAENPALEAVKELLAQRAAVHEEINKLSKAISAGGNEIARIKAGGDLFDVAVIARLAHLHAFSPVAQERLKVHLEFIEESDAEFLGRVSLFIRHTVWRLIQSLHEQARAKVAAQIKGQFKNPDALLQAVEGSDLIQKINGFKQKAEVKYSVSDFYGAGDVIDNYARAQLANYEAVLAFVI